MNTNVPGADANLRLTIKGEVWQPVQVTPRSAAFGRLTAAKANEGMERRLTIVNNVGGELQFSDVTSSNAGFKAEIKPLESGKKYELLVSLVPPLTPGNNTGKITMKTGLSEPATFEVPVYAFVTAPVDVTPTQLTLVPTQTALQRQFYIRGNDGKQFELNDMKCTTDKLKLELTDVRGNKQTYRLSIDIPADYTPPPTGDKITINTTHPDVPVIEIPIVSRAMPQRGRSAATIGNRPVSGKFTGKPIVRPTNRKSAGRKITDQKVNPGQKPDANEKKAEASKNEPPKPEKSKEVEKMKPVG